MPKANRYDHAVDPDIDRREKKVEKDDDRYLKLKDIILRNII